MSVINNGLLLASGADAAAAAGYQISRSLRFNGSIDSAYLSRNFSTNGTDLKIRTFSCWVKRTKLATASQSIFTGYDGSSAASNALYFDGSDKLVLENGSGGQLLTTTQVFRDPSAWFHIVVAIDTTQSTPSNRVKIYINGTQVTQFSQSGYFGQNVNTMWCLPNSNNKIGAWWNNSSYSDFYLAEIHFIDGQALTPSSFGETDATTGAWNPKEYSGSYGTNGFRLPFSDNSGTTSTTLGKDSAGSNNWTPNNFSVAAGSGNDSLVDSPTNYGTDTGAGGEVRGNYATLNPLNKQADCTLANGNLDWSTSANNNLKAFSTIGMRTGKWYCEFTVTAGSDNMIGLFNSSSDVSSLYLGSNANGWGYYQANGNKYNNGASASYGASYAVNDVIGIAFNADNGTLTFYKNGASQGTAYSGLSTSDTYFFALGNGGGSFAVSFNAGQRPFAYTAPSGFKALCTANLPTPTIAKGSDYMDVKLYTGNGSTQTISGLNFSPDFVWFKNRSGAGYHHMLFDTIRGVGNRLNSSTTNAELYDSNTLTAFNSDGFSLSWNGQVNNNLDTFVAWAWDAGANSSKTYTVTVVSGAFYIDGKQQPTLDLEEGSTYTFDLSAASNSGHPFRLSESANGPTQYTTGVTTSGTAGNAGATLTIAVASGAPTLYYFCTNHSGMGGQINTNSTAGASNFAGSITSTVRANASAGFSIVTWTGNSSNSTVGHGLGVAPSLIIAKARNEINFWPVYHASLGRGAYLGLDETSASNTTYADYWGDANPTSTVFGIKGNAGNNRNGKLMLAYCFAPVAGYSTGSSYTGNGSTDGPFVYCGFKPRLILIKNTTSGSTNNWVLFDTARNAYNETNMQLWPNSSNGGLTYEATNSNVPIDILSNGFKVRSTGGDVNTSTNVYIFFAWAENPFSTSRAR